MLSRNPGLQICEATAESAPMLLGIVLVARDADSKPPVLLIRMDKGILKADCRCHDGADGLGGVRGLLEEGGILYRFGYPESVLGMMPLNLVVRRQPSLKQLPKILVHSVIVIPTGFAHQ